MTRQNKLIILAGYLIILAVALPLYKLKRDSANRKLKDELSSMNAGRTKLNSEASEMNRLIKLFPQEAGTVAILEALYTAAQESKLTSHEAITEGGADAGRARNSRRGGAGQKTEDIVITHLKITIEGTYRSIAEYVRRIQNIERFKRFSAIKLTSSKQGVAGTLTLELFSLKGQNEP